MATKRDATEALRANALWASDSPDDWRAALDAYAQRRDALNICERIDAGAGGFCRDTDGNRHAQRQRTQLFESLTDFEFGWRRGDQTP